MLKIKDRLWILRNRTLSQDLLVLIIGVLTLMSRTQRNWNLDQEVQGNQRSQRSVSILVQPSFFEILRKTLRYFSRPSSHKSYPVILEVRRSGSRTTPHRSTVSTLRGLSPQKPLVTSRNCWDKVSGDLSDLFVKDFQEVTFDLTDRT